MDIKKAAITPLFLWVMNAYQFRRAVLCKAM